MPARGAWGTSACIRIISRSIHVHATAGECAFSRASACRAARPAPSGARCIRRSRRPRPAANSTCAVNASSLRESNMTMRAVPPGVVYRDAAGVEQRQRARIVCVAGNAVETPRLLLLSESGRFKNGLANGSGQVGRNYCHHVLSFVFGIFDQPVSFWRGAVLAGVVEDENVHDLESRGFLPAAIITWNSRCWICRPFRSLECLYGWGRKGFQLCHR